MFVFSLLISGVLAFVICLLLTPVVRSFFGDRGLVDQPDGVRKLHKSPVPRLGGIAIMLSYAATLVCLRVLGNAELKTVSTEAWRTWLMVVGVAAIFEFTDRAMAVERERWRFRFILFSDLARSSASVRQNRSYSGLSRNASP